jgi:hypothetical protein
MQKQKIVGLSVLLVVGLFIGHITTVTADDAPTPLTLIGITPPVITPKLTKIYKIAATFSKLAYSGYKKPDADHPNPPENVQYNTLKDEGWNPVWVHGGEKTIPSDKMSMMFEANDPSSTRPQSITPTDSEITEMKTTLESYATFLTEGCPEQAKTLGLLTGCGTGTDTETYFKEDLNLDEDTAIISDIPSKLNDNLKQYEHTYVNLTARPRKRRPTKITTDYAYALGYKKIDDTTVYIIAFRGTVSPINAIVDVLAQPVKFKGSTDYIVHKGFNMFWEECQLDPNEPSDLSKTSPLVDFVQNKVKKDPNKKIVIVTGHSLGAAVAVLEAAHLIADGVSAKKLYLITLAEPCPGTKKFEKQYGKAITNYKWFCNAFDIVPIAPMLVPKRISKWKEVPNPDKFRHFNRRGLMSFDLPEESINPLKKHGIINHINYIWNMPSE